MPPYASIIRFALGALLGACAWPALRALLPFLPIPARFFLGWLLFTIGPGVAAGAWITRSLDPLRRVIVVLGFGSVATAILIDVLGRLHLVAAFPYLASALAGIGAIVWIGARSSPPAAGGASTGSFDARDAAVCVALLALVFGLGAIVFWHRLMPRDGGILVNGAYDSFDLSFYGAWAAEASHTVPPTASYYSGHQFNGAYYPQLVLAMLHRFLAVPILPIYFRYAWPTFLALGALTAFVLVRALASTAVALLAVVLIVAGSDLSYLAAWFLPHATFQWDYLLWPTNFLSPTMEVLQFNTWAPTLPVFFTALYAIVRGLQTGERGWTVASAVLLATLFQFKPFAYIVLMGALVAAALFSTSDAVGRRRFAVTTGLTVLLTLPFVYSVMGIHEDRRSRLLLDLFLLPQRMLIKIDLTDTFTRLAARLAPWAPLRRPLLLLMATAVFLFVGLGVRWLGVPGVWRAVRRQDGADAAAWRLLGWCVVAGVAIPFVLATEPYIDTLQFYETGLYVLWIFTAAALIAFRQRNPRLGALAIAAALLVALPSSVHYLWLKWTDHQRPALASLSRADLAFADYLLTRDPETTVILHDRPVDPSLMAVASDRRVMLGWGPKYYAVGSEDRMRDINAFYASANGDPAAALDMLHRYHVTHVIVYERDHVHPDVMARLEPVLRFPGAALYAVR